MHFFGKALNEDGGVLQPHGIGDKGALALHPFQVTVVDQGHHGGANGGTADAKLLTQLQLRGEHMAYRPLAALDLCHDIFGNLGV